jgi:hypothetical protein
MNDEVHGGIFILRYAVLKISPSIMNLDASILFSQESVIVLHSEPK